MNANNKNHSTDDAIFDRLADGQLNERQRRDLLAGLDDEPDGWRRCALAFLEAQCWKQTFGAIAREIETISSAGPAAAPRPARSPWPGRLGAALAMAASFLLALWLGWQLQRDRIGDLARDARPAASPIAAVPGGEMPSEPWRLVTVSAPGRNGKPGRAIELPALERDRLDERWLQGAPQAIPERVRAALARTGHEVQQRRELLPVPLDDGRQLVVPVDNVDVHYVGDGPY